MTGQFIWVASLIDAIQMILDLADLEVFIRKKYISKAWCDGEWPPPGAAEGASIVDMATPKE